MKHLLVLILILIPSAASAEALDIVTSLDPLEATEYIEAFKKDTGIDVQWIRLSAGEALTRLKAESANSSQDVWFGAPLPEFIAAKKSGLLAPVDAIKNLRAIPERWRDPEGYWIGIYFGAIAFISGAGVNPPGSWQDLLRPEYRNEIAVSYPYTAGTGFTILAGLIAIMGEEGAIEYYRDLDRQVRRYMKSGGAPIIDVGLGEAGVGIVFDQDANRKGKSRGFDITITYPADGVPYEIGAVAAIRGGDEALARKFIEWAASLRAQNLMHIWYRVPLHPKAKINEANRRPEDLNLAPMDFEKAGAQREGIIRRWRERIGR